MKIRLKVKEVADEKGFNMTKLSHRSEIAFTTIKSMFRDPYRTVNTDTLRRVAEALGVSIHDLLEEEEED